MIIFTLVNQQSLIFAFIFNEPPSPTRPGERDDRENIQDEHSPQVVLRRQRDPPDQDAILIIRGDKVHEDVKSEDRQGEDRPPIQERTEDIGGVREAEFEGDDERFDRHDAHDQNIPRQAERTCRLQCPSVGLMMRVPHDCFGRVEGRPPRAQMRVRRGGSLALFPLWRG